MPQAKKVGRNDPCPCGSGAKYKKCCLGDGPAPVATRPTTSAITTRHPSGGGRHPSGGGRLVRAPLPPSRWPNERLWYGEGLARAFAKGETFDGFDPHGWTRATLRDEVAVVDGTAPHPRTSIAGVRKMATPEILAELAALGLDVSEATFDVKVEDEHSAWNLGERWLAKAGEPGEHAEFIRLAACELWRRWLPESPSVEMLDDLIQEGYLAQEQGAEGNTLELWLRAGRWLVELTPDDITTVQEVGTWFPGRNSVANWLGDLTFALHNATITELPLRERARRLYVSWVQRFEPSAEQRRLRYSLAQMHFRCGDVDAGEEACRDLIEEQPSAVSAYMLLSNEFAANGRKAEAIALLESACGHLEDDRDKQFIAEALQRLRATTSA